MDLPDQNRALILATRVLPGFAKTDCRTQFREMNAENRNGTHQGTARKGYPNT